MKFISTDYTLFSIILVLLILALFCYDIGISANTIKPGIGNVMLNLSLASGLLTILTGVNLTVIQRKKMRKWWNIFRRK